MPSREMLDVIEGFRAKKRERAAGQVDPPLAEIRAHFAPAGRLHAIPSDVTVTAVKAGGVPAYWLVPPGADPHRVLFYLHGGGFMVGSLRSHGEIASRLGRAAGARVLLPEYRLAPENPFPAAADDVRAAWRWLRDELHQGASGIALAGDSAGGTLALALLTGLRDAGEPLPAATTLLSPMTDLTCSGASMREGAVDDPIFTPGMIRGFSTGYLAGADARAPRASPLFADLKGLSPLLLLVGTAELLLSDAERLAAGAREAGVDVTLRLGEGLPHVYPIMQGTPEAAAATDEIGRFFRVHLGGAAR